MFRVVVGSYQHVLYGFDVTNASALEKNDKSKNEEDDEHNQSTSEEEQQSTANTTAIRLKPRFSCSQLHTGAIKAIAVQSSGTFCVSGSTDETIKILNLKKNVEVGSLLEHEGAITAVSFYSTTHMISSGEDGKICVWKTKEWELLWTIKAHKGGVNGFSIHPSGRIIISVGKDSHLRLWNLITGKSAFDKKLPFVPSGVIWSPSGNHYAIIHSYHVLIYNQEGEELHDLTGEDNKELLAWAFITDTLFAAGGENKLVQVWDITTGSVVHLLAGHSNRIRGISAAPVTPEDGELPYIVSTDTDGTIVVWNPNVEKKFVCHFELPARVISLATGFLPTPTKILIGKVSKKKKISKVVGKSVQAQRKRKKIE